MEFRNVIANRDPIVFCGPSGTGKTTFCKLLIKLQEYFWDSNVIHMDGDDLRNTINSDLAFSKEDIQENMRRICGIKNWLYNTYQCDKVIVSIIAPHKENRKYLRDNGFKVVHLERPECYTEDRKGLYKSGKQVPYETPVIGEDVDFIVDWSAFDYRKKSYNKHEELLKFIESI